MEYSDLIRDAATTARGNLPGSAVTFDRLEAIAGDLELAVDSDPRLAGTNVRGVCRADIGLIALNPDLGESMRRFVLAHEIGHIALKHRERTTGAHFAIFADTDGDIRETVSPADLSDAAIRAATGIDTGGGDDSLVAVYSERDRWEREANAFAAELLLPAAGLRAILETEPGWTAAGLCERFGVSRTLLYTQLSAALAPPVSTPAPPEPAAFALSPDQARAVYVPAPALVTAGPGAGKTRVLVERAARLVREGHDPRRILALTFGNKAAGEMRGRLARLLADDPGRPAIEVWTFHAFGSQLLREYGAAIGFTSPRLVTPSDALLLLRRRAADLPAGVFADPRYPARPLADLLAAVSRLKDENHTPDEYAAMAQAWLQSAAPDDREAAERAVDLAETYRVYQTLLVENGYVDYGDLIMDALRLLDHGAAGPLIRARYDHLLVDEFQDINYASGRLVRALDAGRGIVWAVGDPKQSIYGFRGASPVSLARFKHEYAGAADVPLGTNYRSLAPIVAAGQAVCVPSVPTLALAAHRAGAGEPCVRYHEAATQDSEAAFIASEIERLRDTENIPLGSIAVLCRSATIAAPVAALLSARGIAHTWGGDLSARPAFKRMMGALYLAADDARGIEPLTRLPESLLSERERRALFAHIGDYPTARALLRAATGGRIAGVGGKAILALHRIEQIAGALSAAARPFINLCRYLFEEAVWFRDLLRPGVSGTLAARETLAAARQTLLVAAHFAERQSLIGAAGDTTAAFLEYLEGALETDSLRLPLELPADAGAVNVLTAHGAKGLEYPVVFVPGLARGRFPARPQPWKEFPFPPDTIRRAAPDETDAAAHEREEACLFYVAVTRAKNRLYLSRARKYPATWQNAPADAATDLREDLRRRALIVETFESDADGYALAAAFAPTRFPAAEPPLPTPFPEAIAEYALSQYAVCPRRYLLQFVYGLDAREKPFLAFHGGVHETLAALTAAESDGTVRTPEAIAALCAAVWARSGPPPDHWCEPIWARVADEIARGEAARLAGAGGARHARRSVLVALPAVDNDACARRVRVTIHAGETVAAPDGTTRAVLKRHHFGKPSKKAATPDSKDALYTLYGEQEYGAAYEATHCYPRHDAEEPIQMTPKVRQNRIADMRRSCAGIESGAFPLQGKRDDCRSCPFVLTCPGTGGEE